MASNPRENKMSGLAELSMRIYRQLDCTGCNKKMIDMRRKHYRNLGNFQTLRSRRKTVISGSRGEGMTKQFGSDQDVLYFEVNSLCVEVSKSGVENLDVENARSGVVKSKLGVEDSSVGVENSRTGVENSKFGVENSRFGVEDSSVGVENSRTGVENSKFGVENSRFGVENSRIGLGNLRIGVENSRIGVENSRFGVENSRSGAENSSSGVDNLTSGIGNLTLGAANSTLELNNPTSIDCIPAHVTVFGIVNTLPGYCMLELLRHGTTVDDGINNCLVPYNEKVMLSSQVVVREVFKDNVQTGVTKTGPAQTNALGVGTAMTQDHVFTISCQCPSILRKWKDRPRTHDWPSSSLRQQVSQMAGNLVSTGSDDSEIEHLEWRYCFNEIEMLILATLNDTQLKLYKLMKMLNGDVFKQRGLSLTSFMMKNIILWLAEIHPQSTFLPETLYHWLVEALMLLKWYVEANHLPYYIIPGRNLLREKLKESDRPKLIQVITDVLQSGPAVVFECKALRKYAALTPPELVVLKQKLEVLELCEMKMQHTNEILRQQRKVGKQDALIHMLSYRMSLIVSSGWPEQVQRQIHACQDGLSALKMLLS